MYTPAHVKRHRKVNLLNSLPPLKMSERETSKFISSHLIITSLYFWSDLSSWIFSLSFPFPRHLRPCHSLHFINHCETIWTSKMSPFFQPISVRWSVRTRFTQHRLIAWRWLYVCAPAGPSISHCDWCVANLATPEQQCWRAGRCSMMTRVGAFWWSEGMTEKLCRFSLSWVAVFCEEACQINSCASLWFWNPLLSRWSYLILHEIMAPCVKCNGKLHWFTRTCVRFIEVVCDLSAGIMGRNAKWSHCGLLLHTPSSTSHCCRNGCVI